MSGVFVIANVSVTTATDVAQLKIVMAAVTDTIGKCCRWLELMTVRNQLRDMAIL